MPLYSLQMFDTFDENMQEKLAKKAQLEKFDISCARYNRNIIYIKF